MGQGNGLGFLWVCGFAVLSLAGACGGVRKVEEGGGGGWGRVPLSGAQPSSPVPSSQPLGCCIY